MNLTGGCICSAVRYELNEAPLFVHACHCSDCQRFSGSAFVVLLGVEKAVFNLTGTTEKVTNATPSGAGYDAHFCPNCSTIIWSKYHFVEAPLIAVRGGTLDEPGLAPPDYHIFTQSKQPWVILPEGMPAFDGWLEPEEAWSPETLKRMAELA
mgnify:CR=1 FL=1